MDILTTVMTTLTILAKFAPTVLQAGADLKPYAVALYQELSGKVPTAAERSSLEAGVDALFARLETPLPDARPGDPDYVAP